MKASSLTFAIAVIAVRLFGDPILVVPPLAQNDPRWSNQLIDHSSLSIGDFGCTLTAWTMAINYELAQAGIKQGGVTMSYTPAEINKLLNDYRSEDPNTHTVYDGWGVPVDVNNKPTRSDTNLNVGALVNAIKIDTFALSDGNESLVLKKLHIGKVDPAGEVIGADYKPFLDALAAGHPIVARVNGAVDPKTGLPTPNSHTVLVTGLDATGKWIIADPFNDPNNPIDRLNHSDYGNKIFGTDWAVFQKGGLPDPYGSPSPYLIDPMDLYNPNINPDKYGLFHSVPNSAKFAPTPEPSTIGMFAAGICMLILSGRLGRRLNPGRSTAALEPAD